MTTYIDLNELDEGKPHWLANKSVQASLDIPITLANDKQDGHWITTHGERVFIKEGQDVGEAIKERFAKPTTGNKFSDKISSKDIEKWDGFRKQIAQQAIDDYLGDMEGPANSNVKLIALRDSNDVLKGVGSYEVNEDKDFGVRSLSRGFHINFLATAERGYGRSMMEQFAELAIKENKGISLVAADDAVGFYKKLGMRQQGNSTAFLFSLDDCKEFVKKNKPIAASLENDNDEPLDGVFVVKSGSHKSK